MVVNKKLNTRPAKSVYKYVPGDWICPTCEDLQFRRNQNCRICGTTNPMVLAQELALAAGQQFPPPPPPMHPPQTKEDSLIATKGDGKTEGGAKGEGKSGKGLRGLNKVHPLRGTEAYKRALYDMNYTTAPSVPPPPPPAMPAGYFAPGMPTDMTAYYDASAMAGYTVLPGYPAPTQPVYFQVPTAYMPVAPCYASDAETVAPFSTGYYTPHELVYASKETMPYGSY